MILRQIIIFILYCIIFLGINTPLSTAFLGITPQVIHSLSTALLIFCAEAGKTLQCRPENRRYARSYPRPPGQKAEPNRRCRQKKHGGIIHTRIPCAALFGEQEHCAKQTIDCPRCADGNACIAAEQHAEHAAAKPRNQIQHQKFSRTQKAFRPHAKIIQINAVVPDGAVLHGGTYK